MVAKLTAPKLTRTGRGLGVSALRLRVRTCSYGSRVTHQDTDCLLVLLYLLYRTFCSYHAISACVSSRVLSIGYNSNGEWFIFYSAWVFTCSVHVLCRSILGTVG